MQTKIRSGAVAAPLRLAPQETGQARRTRLAGALLALTGIGTLMSIITSEALYPAARHYNTFSNTISDLGGTSPPNSYMVQPNRAIFIATMAVAGTLVLVSTYLLWPSVARRRISIGLLVFGASLAGLAVFPGNVPTWHPWIALACFMAGSITAIMSRKVLDPPVTYFAVALGVTALVATLAGLEAFEGVGPQEWIGLGGVERWIAYPVLMWLVMFGTALMSRLDGRSRSEVGPGTDGGEVGSQ
jgi:hypothetical membrane protein